MIDATAAHAASMAAHEAQEAARLKVQLALVERAVLAASQRGEFFTTVEPFELLNSSALRNTLEERGYTVEIGVRRPRFQVSWGAPKKVGRRG